MTATTKLVSARFLPYSLHLSCRLVFPRTFIDNLVDVSEVLSFSPSCTWYPPSGCAYHTFLHISYVGTRTVFLHVFVFLDDRHFYSPPVRGFGLSDLLDKPWSQVGVFPFPPVLDFIFNRAKGSAFPPFSFFSMLLVDLHQIRPTRSSSVPPARRFVRTSPLSPAIIEPATSTSQ